MKANRAVRRRGSHIFYSRLTDGSEVSLALRPPFTPQED
jgi:predicted RNA binding protein YcfA (HicA-like mRNA interferase family)